MTFLTGKQSPWGRIDYSEELCPGIYTVGTPSHGGIKLDREHNAKMPDEMRHSGRWYEEDCDWCLPFVVFQDEILNGQETYACRSMYTGAHIRTMRNWHPDLFEQWFNTKLKPGESYLKDKRQNQTS